MKSTRFILLLISLFVSPVAKPQALDWQTASEWRLYDSIYSSQKFYPDSLNLYKYIGLDNPTMQRFLTNTSTLPPERTKGAVWMGFYRVSCMIHDTTRILIVSRYGGFFADLASKQYYQIPVADISDWNEYFDSKFSDLHQK